MWAKYQFLCIYSTIFERIKWKHTHEVSAATQKLQKAAKTG